MAAGQRICSIIDIKWKKLSGFDPPDSFFYFFFLRKYTVKKPVTKNGSVEENTL
jgi:hypothetical protein